MARLQPTGKGGPQMVTRRNLVENYIDLGAVDSLSESRARQQMDEAFALNLDRSLARIGVHLSESGNAEAGHSHAEVHSVSEARATMERAFRRHGLTAGDARFAADAEAAADEFIE
jgi:hypothetical protein